MPDARAYLRGRYVTLPQGLERGPPGDPAVLGTRAAVLSKRNVYAAHPTLPASAPAPAAELPHSDGHKDRSAYASSLLPSTYATVLLPLVEVVREVAAGPGVPVALEAGARMLELGHCSGPPGDSSAGLQYVRVLDCATGGLSSVPESCVRLLQRGTGCWHRVLNVGLARVRTQPSGAHVPRAQRPRLSTADSRQRPRAAGRANPEVESLIALIDSAEARMRMHEQAEQQQRQGTRGNVVPDAVCYYVAVCEKRSVWVHEAYVMPAQGTVLPRPLSAAEERQLAATRGDTTVERHEPNEPNASLKLLLLPANRSTDFERHRNWMAATHSLPVSEWYNEGRESEWFIECPPLFALFQWALSFFARLVDPALVSSGTSGLSTAQQSRSLAFQRAAVILSDAVYVIALIRFCSRAYGLSKTKKVDHGTAVLCAAVLSPALLLVDHVHLQYCGMMHGLLVLAAGSAWSSSYLSATIAFSLLLNFRPSFACLAPAFALHVFRAHCFASPRVSVFESPRRWREAFQMPRFLQLVAGAVVIFLLSFGPFLGDLPELLSRILPTGKGPCNVYWAPNFWALYNVADKAVAAAARYVRGAAPMSFHDAATAAASQTFEVLPAPTPEITLVLFFLTLIPILWRVWKEPSPQRFVLSLVQSGASYFLFGWQMQETAILMAIIPLYLLAGQAPCYARWAIVISTAGHAGILPLIYTPMEIPIKWVTVCVHTLFTAILLTWVHSPRGRITGLRVWRSLHSTLEIAYFVLVAVVEVYSTAVHPWFLAATMPFLPLVLVSFTAALGVLYGTVRVLLL
eukprot:m51a1_g2087 putative probable dolichyl pyrophosphate glc1man9 c2 alpha- -glucosyltransferase (801) ;mRNA; f:1514885-1518305